MRINETHIAKMLRLAEAGKTSRQIGAEVGCSPTTVRKYVSLRLQNQREGLRALYPAVWDWRRGHHLPPDRREIRLQRVHRLQPAHRPRHPAQGRH